MDGRVGGSRGGLMGGWVGEWTDRMRGGWEMARARVVGWADGRARERLGARPHWTGWRKTKFDQISFVGLDQTRFDPTDPDRRPRWPRRRWSKYVVESMVKSVVDFDPWSNLTRGQVKSSFIRG
jgi:hypothetical protein